MALAQFVREPLNQRITKRMFSPKKRISDPMQWYKDAQKLIKELPELRSIPPLGQELHVPNEQEYWYLANEPEISVRYLKFTLTNLVGERAHLVIDRTAPCIG